MCVHPTTCVCARTTESLCVDRPQHTHTHTSVGVRPHGRAGGDGHDGLYHPGEKAAKHDVSIPKTPLPSLPFSRTHVTPQLTIHRPNHQANPGVVSVLEEHRHGLETGDVVMITEVEGMEQVQFPCVRVGMCVQGGGYVCIHRPHHHTLPPPHTQPNLIQIKSIR